VLLRCLEKEDDEKVLREIHDGPAGKDTIDQICLGMLTHMLENENFVK